MYKIGQKSMKPFRNLTSIFLRPWKIQLLICHALPLCLTD